MTFHRYVALGDSFTEGVGDHDADRPNGVRGWADRMAEAMAARTPDLGYVNLAIRGRKLGAIVDEQLARTLELSPDLVTIYAGVNDLLRPKVDIDRILWRYDDMLGKLKASGATVLVFTGFDTGFAPVFRHLRGRVAVYNEIVRELVDRHDLVLLDYWRRREYRDYRLWDVDRMHMSAAGHTHMAALALQALGLDHDLPRVTLEPLPVMDRRQQREADRAWARAHMGPWVNRRIRGSSTGDGLNPKFPSYVSPRTWEPIG